jgi:hypothetical protein
MNAFYYFMQLNMSQVLLSLFYAIGYNSVGLGGSCRELSFYCFYHFSLYLHSLPETASFLKASIFAVGQRISHRQRADFADGKGPPSAKKGHGQRPPLLMAWLSANTGHRQSPSLLTV